MARAANTLQGWLITQGESMAWQNTRGLRGVCLAALLGLVGCGDPGKAEPPSESAAEAMPRLASENEEASSPCPPRHPPAFMLENSPGVSSSYYSPALTPLNGRVYFLGPILNGGPSTLWRSDATEAGTYPIQENVHAPVMKAGPLLYFAQNGSLWASDGTTAGTRWLKSLEGGLPGAFLDVRGRLFFFISRASTGELWVSNGTPAGTGPIASLPSVPYALRRMVEFRGRLFFVTENAEWGRELWTSDGTPGGTHVFKDIAPGSASSSPSQLMVADGTLYFVADDQLHGQELWAARSLNPAHTSMVRDFVPGLGWSRPTLFAELHGRLYFTIHPADQPSDLELWRTDGLPRGTVRVKRIHSADPEFEELSAREAFPVGNGVRSALALGNSVYFVIQPIGTMGPWAGTAQLWVTDGTSRGTRSVTEGLSFGDMGPIPELLAAHRTLLFASWDELHGRELWSSQGTASSTCLLQDLLPGPGWSYPFSFVQAGHTLYFLAADASYGDRLWALPVKSLRSHPVE